MPWSRSLQYFRLKNDLMQPITVLMLGTKCTNDNQAVSYWYFIINLQMRVPNNEILLPGIVFQAACNCKLSE